jgi:hypothetical protein
MTRTDKKTHLVLRARLSDGQRLHVRCQRIELLAQFSPGFRRPDRLLDRQQTADVQMAHRSDHLRLDAKAHRQRIPCGSDTWSAIRICPRRSSGRKAAANPAEMIQAG